MDRHRRATTYKAALLAGVFAAAVAVAAVVVLALGPPATVAHDRGRPPARLATIEGSASPCTPMSTGWYSSRMAVAVYRGSHVVARMVLNPNRRLIPFELYRYRVRVPPGRYVVRASTGVWAAVRATTGRTATADVGDEGCK